MPIALQLRLHAKAHLSATSVLPAHARRDTAGAMRNAPVFADSLYASHQMSHFLQGAA